MDSSVAMQRPEEAANRLFVGSDYTSSKGCVHDFRNIKRTCFFSNLIKHWTGSFKPVPDTDKLD